MGKRLSIFSSLRTTHTCVHLAKSKLLVRNENHGCPCSLIPSTYMAVHNLLLASSSSGIPPTYCLPQDTDSHAD